MRNQRVMSKKLFSELLDEEQYDYYLNEGYSKLEEADCLKDWLVRQGYIIKLTIFASCSVELQKIEKSTDLLNPIFHSSNELSCLIKAGEFLVKDKE